ncbi:SSI family serine proteinase inhibitor [Streptomyces naphthomycinicus]|uniref:SSI family serine proteinase inhibitor n=1 Tax=Streptomyces naphthomycinicus TaxID=2872625 RepID=UPI001CEC1C01|nr:SSI family serine proteinase inhibitor [Streptomyces sp. TML10]
MTSVLPGAGWRLLAASLASAASLAPLTAVPAAAAGAVPPPVRAEDQGDHLTVVVRRAGAGRDGTYEIRCHPAAGRHPDADGACRTLDARTRWGRDPFAPVAPGTTCTMLYGGPATARVTGTWAGRPVDASYDRGDGCAIGRWDRMVPLLPRTGPDQGTEDRADAPVP